MALGAAPDMLLRELISYIRAGARAGERRRRGTTLDVAAVNKPRHPARVPKAFICLEGLQPRPSIFVVPEAEILKSTVGLTVPISVRWRSRARAARGSAARLVPVARASRHRAQGLCPARAQLSRSTEKARVMVGPGTGVAPFRAFLQATSARRRDAWLFFGHPAQRLDFFYEEEFAVAGATGANQAVARLVAQRRHAQDLRCKTGCAPGAELSGAWLQRRAPLLISAGRHHASGGRRREGDDRDHPAAWRPRRAQRQDTRVSRSSRAC